MASPNQLLSFHSAILFQARLNPYAIAVIYGGRNITYHTFTEHIEAVTRRLHAQNIAPQSRVAVSVQEGYLKWIVVIALARMGMPSASMMGHASEADFIRATVFITDTGENVSPSRQTITIDSSWIQPAENLPFVEVPHDKDAPFRIVLSSGTTGLPKKALFTYLHLRERSRGTSRIFGLSGTTRIMSTMSISTIGGFFTPVNVWANGGTVILSQPRDNDNWSKVLMRTRPNLLFTSTLQLASLINGLPKEFRLNEQLIAYVAGSALPYALNRRARLRLTEQLYVLYGSTEAGGTAMVHASAQDSRPEFTGYVLPTAEVQVVDEQGAPLPFGTLGEIRIRADGLVDEYLEDTQANDGSFRDAWFYPGDAGTLDADSGLSVLGRTRELMNFGGVKISPDSIEAGIGKMPGVDDMAVFSIDGADRQPRPHVAVVAGKEFSGEELLARYRRAFPLLPVISVVKVASIPRNEMGKVQRTRIIEDMQKTKG